VVATRNPHKLEEIGEILAGFELEPLPDSVQLPPEDGDTFAANALGKARAAREQTGRAAIADDSGIAAAALGGAPGVRSARYAGDDATDAENLDLLLAEVGRTEDRAVAYVCAIAYVDEDGEVPAVRAGGGEQTQCHGLKIMSRRISALTPASVPALRAAST